MLVLTSDLIGVAVLFCGLGAITILYSIITES
jgi:hypothetical protein